MAKKPILEWNQTQLKIAKLLSEGMTASEISALDEFTQSTVFKVQRHIKKGDKPPSLDEAYIATAPPPTPFPTKGSTVPEGHKLAPAKASGDGGKEPGKKKESPGLLRMTPIVITCQYTPIMYIARQAAVEQWGWDPDIPFEDFMDTILYHAFKDRGITLQGYILDEEVAKV